MNGPDLQLDTAAVVRRAVMSLGRRLRHEQPESGRTAAELSILGHLLRSGPMTPGRLAATERVQPQTLTRTLASLADSQLVGRREHPSDGRSVLLELTGAGLAALRHDMAARDAWLSRAMARSLTAEECELLRRAAALMDRLADSR
jgi:DNA-binding MarR family transcriptional regulator